MIDIQAKFSHHRKDDVREIVYDLYAKGLLIGIPDRKAGIWFRKYYARPVNEVSAAERLEEVFTELGIPPYIEVRVSRAGKTFLIGDYGNTPFAIVDYSTNPPLMFHDRRAGGAADEIVYSSRMFRYKCKKPGVVKWYDHHGNPARIIS